MNILFDFVHPADVNLFKQSIISLYKANHVVFLSLRKRGALQRIAEFEFPDFQIKVIGSHQKGFLNKIFAFFYRDLCFFNILRKNKIEVAICQGLSFGISCKILHIPIINHEDDPEYKITYLIGKYLSTRDVMPEYLPVYHRNFIKYKGFKELAYLHPEYFHPDTHSLSSLKLTQFKYVFIREISNISVNYKGRKSFLDEILKILNRFNIQVILSLEDKSLVTVYEGQSMILQEPVKDLYSLIYYSKFVISSGDTMARESCLLGVPCIYTGGRTMSVNDVFIQLCIMWKSELVDEIRNKIIELLSSENDQVLRANMSEFIAANYDDVNKIITNQILTVTN